jgi:serralysin
VPIAGTVSQLRITDSGGNTLITFAGLQSNPVGGDLSQLVSDILGSPFDDAGPGPDGKMAWQNLTRGNDTVNGTSGDDWREIVGLDRGNDLIRMYGGDDYVQAGAGNDTMNGGAGYDYLSYNSTTFNEGASATRGLTLNVATGVAQDPWGGTDRFSAFEEFQGSRYNDTFIGAGFRDRFEGLRGNDTFRGGAGSDDENGRDELRYNNDYWHGGRFGITVDLQTGVVNGQIRGTIRDGFGNTDTTFDIERVGGTRFNDTFVGSSASNVFWGGEGRDRFDGAGEWDAVRFSRNFGDNGIGDVVVNLSLASGQVINDGFGNRETLISIEEVEGGDGNDSLRGNAQDNGLHGDNGRDTLTGGGGNDVFGFWDQDFGGEGDRITDFRATGANEQDRLGFDVEAWEGMTSTLRFVNGNGPTIAQGQFYFRASNETLYWDPDGTGSDAAIAVVQLVGVASLSAANFDL